MSKITKSIEVDVPVTTAYNQWTQFEEFPRFMEGVKSVRQLDDKTLEWTAEIAGVARSWRAEIVDQTADRRVSWRSTSGTRNNGVVTFEPLGDKRTRVTVEMDVDPEGLVENIGDALGILDRRIQGDLERFQEFIEARGRETGAWRGEVKQGARTR
ncbi:MAG: SRPBCC family protein [Chloroflexota bacterium]|nr:SRPBCC family protein [Chloroflexota bacterium]